MGPGIQRKTLIAKSFEGLRHIFRWIPERNRKWAHAFEDDEVGKGPTKRKGVVGETTPFRARALMTE